MSATVHERVWFLNMIWLRQQQKYPTEKLRNRLSKNTKYPGDTWGVLFLILFKIIANKLMCVLQWHIYVQESIPSISKEVLTVNHQFICRENIVHLDIYYKKLRYFVIEQKEGKTLPNLVCKYSSYRRFFFQSKKLEFAIDAN